ncbi:hypothetical protein ACIBEK_13990 [Nocardia fusca]|uniref:Uncharacterized protein n=1 Tax=Nocardia fusca TaxID=941183 RepID=A0ABV3F9J5_9NOCA
MIRKLTATPAPGGATAAVAPAAEPTAATESALGTPAAVRATVATRSSASADSTIAPRREVAVDKAGGSGAAPRPSVPREPVCSAPTSWRSVARAAPNRARWAPACKRPAA